MVNLYLTVGIPGSGKSYTAEHLSKIIPNSIVVSRDEIRFSLLQPGDQYFSKEKQVFNFYVQEIANNLRQGKVVIADSTNLTIASRRKLLSALPKVYDEIGIIYLDTPVYLAQCRNNTRRGLKQVPYDVIEKMSNEIQKPNFISEPQFSVIITYDSDNLKPKFEFKK